jgi:vacuolar-type H+-ATPase subunit H
MTKWTIPETPSPEAIAKAALERAAKLFDQDADDMQKEENSFYWTAEMDAERIRALADNRDEINAILLKAGKDRG